jgi:hypothetical protein
MYGRRLRIALPCLHEFGGGLRRKAPPTGRAVRESAPMGRHVGVELKDGPVDGFALIGRHGQPGGLPKDAVDDLAIEPVRVDLPVRVVLDIECVEGLVALPCDPQCLADGGNGGGLLRAQCGDDPVAFFERQRARFLSPLGDADVIDGFADAELLCVHVGVRAAAVRRFQVAPPKRTGSPIRAALSEERPALAPGPVGRRIVQRLLEVIRQKAGQLTAERSLAVPQEQEFFADHLAVGVEELLGVHAVLAVSDRLADGDPGVARKGRSSFLAQGGQELPDRLRPGGLHRFAKAPDGGLDESFLFLLGRLVLLPGFLRVLLLFALD